VRDGEAIAEDLAVSLRRPAEAARRDAGGTMKRANEVGEVTEPDVERDVGDRPRVVGEQTRRVVSIAGASAAIGIVATVCELLPLRIDDNLTIPIFVAFASWGLAALFGVALA
jgi:hypothetical protein